MNETVLILGAGGRLGRVLVDAFAGAGWQVLAQARRPLSGAVPAGVREVRAPMGDAAADTAALAEAARGAAVVVNALNPIYTKWEGEAQRLACAAMDVAEALGATLLFPGNVYNYGAGMPPLLTPGTPPAPTSRKGEIRCGIEARMQARAPGLRSVVIRAGDFFGGPGRGSWMDEVVLKSLERGKVAYPGPLDCAHAWAYLPDLARAFVAVAARRAALPGFSVLHFPGHTLTGAQLAAAIGEARGGEKPRVCGFPWWLIRSGAVVVPMWRELAQMKYLWDVPHALDGAALRACVGELPGTPAPLADSGGQRCRQLRHWACAVGAQSSQESRPSPVNCSPSSSPCVRPSPVRLRRACRYRSCRAAGRRLPPSTRPARRPS